MKIKKQTGSQISTIAAHPMRTVKEIRAMAASLMSQDEKKGQ